VRIRGTGALALAVGLAIAGCGGSSKSSSSSTASSTTSTTSSAASSTTSSAASSAAASALTKAQYEAQLGPLLNGRVAPALKTALSNGGIANPSKLSVAIANVKLAHDRMAAVTPPSAIADIHAKAVTLLGSLVSDLTKLRAAELKKSKNDALSALNAIKNDGQTIITIGSEFTARGF
jgi:hypothetical protein